MVLHLPSPVQQLKSSFFEKHEIEFWLKRDDLIHPEISGNKWRKLELNVLKAKDKNQAILTFGGAYSNHIAATAAACYYARIPCIGLIRGEELDVNNSTLSQAKEYGMTLHFISRDEYRQKNEEAYIRDLYQSFGSFHLVPEGGANYYGVMGCSNIISEIDQDVDVFCCSAGTGTTAAGMLLSLRGDEQLEVYPALKGAGFIQKDIAHLLHRALFDSDVVESQLQHMNLILDYHFGGFAKLKPQKKLVEFVNDFYNEFDIPLDLIYNGKMIYGIFERIKKGKYKSQSKIMALHCGGLQGNQGMKSRYDLQLAY